MSEILRNKSGLSVKVTLDDSKLQAMLRAIPDALQRRAFRAAVTKASQVINRTAKRLVPVESGLLKKSIGYKIKSFTNSQNGTIGYYGVIGPRVDGFKMAVPRTKGRRVVKGRPGTMVMSNPVKYAHLVALGVRPHSVPVTGKKDSANRKTALHPGHNGVHFMREAANATRSQVEAAMVGELQKAIDKAKG